MGVKYILSRHGYRAPSVRAHLRIRSRSFASGENHARSTESWSRKNIFHLEEIY